MVTTMALWPGSGIASLSIGVAIFYVILKTLKRARQPPLPPGPKGLPLVGNINDMPTPGVIEAQHWMKHKELYGPISSLTILGQTLVIVNDAEVAKEILERRSAKNSSRPRQEFAGEMVGWAQTAGTCPYNKRFRTYRKNFSRIMGSKVAVSQFNTLQEEEVGHFLLHLLEDPDGFDKHIRKETGSLILRLAYGYIAESHEPDYLVDLVGNVMDTFTRIAVPGAYLVDVVTWLRYLPEWLPGIGFKKSARQWAAELTEMTERPYYFAKHQRAQGSFEPSFLSKLLDAGDENAEEQLTNKWSAQALYAAGSDTTVSSVLCFFLAMMVYPEVQQEAQKEIDCVVGKDRLPNLADMDRLPYIEAVVKEILRWHPVAPMSVPHTSTEDDVFDGYIIPRGAAILPNIWHFTHDPSVYEDPMVFKPERYLKDVPDPDPTQFVFGYGRRICPGRLLAKNSIYLNIAQVLSVYDISKPVENGRVVEPTVGFEPGVISHPLPFKATIKPRSSHHKQLIESIENMYPWRESDSKRLESLGYKSSATF